MKDQLYKAVEINDEGSTEPVNYVGVYTLNWQKEWGKPEIGFTKYENEITDADIEVWTKDYFKKVTTPIDDISKLRIEIAVMACAKAALNGEIKHIDNK